MSKTQNKAQGLLEQLIMAHERGVNPEPYHNKPNPEISVRKRGHHPEKVLGDQPKY